VIGGLGSALNLAGSVVSAVTGNQNDDQPGRRPEGGELQEAYDRCERAIRDHVPGGRQQSLALTNLEQSALWARAAIEGAR